VTKPQHPKPAVIGDYVTGVAKILQDEIRHDSRKTHCRCLECTVARLAQTGWPTTTTGDGRGGNDIEKLNGVESAATEMHPFAGMDTEFARLLRTFWLTARMVEDKVHKIRKHESDTEQLAGLGDCVACGHFCNPRKDPNDRRRNGYCNACRLAWTRWLKLNPDGLRPDFVRARRAALKAQTA
jgi:hypothetical protein